MNNQHNQWPDAEDGIRPDQKPKLFQQLRHTVMIGAGVLILIYALFNILSDLHVFNREDVIDWGKGLFATVTPEVVNYRSVRINVQEAGTVYPTTVVEDNVFDTPTPEPTALLHSTEEAGFVPLQIEQSQFESEVETIDQEIPLMPPTRLIIPAIGLDAPVIPAEKEEVKTDGVVYEQWLAPDKYAVGWHSDSVGLGQIGNMVLNGHHNVHGEVFKDLDKLQAGDRISVYGEDSQRYGYIVTNIMILPERDVSVEERLQNARWILPSADQRLTLVTCWPYYSNTHRLIIVASPLETGSFEHQ